jgi:anti-sigma factor RsiW
MSQVGSTGGAHEPYVGLIARAADGSLDEGGRQELDAHLTQCPTCRAALDEQREARQVLMSWRPELASPEFASRVIASLPAKPWWHAWDLQWWTWRLAPVAGALAVAAAVVVTRGDATDVVDVPSVAEATADRLPASVALATKDLSDGDALTLLLVADPDETVIDAFQEIRR